MGMPTRATAVAYTVSRRAGGTGVGGSSNRSTRATNGEPANGSPPLGACAPPTRAIAVASGTGPQCRTARSSASISTRVATAAPATAGAATAPEKAVLVPHGATPVTGSYIVVLKDGTAASSAVGSASATLARRYGGTVTTNYGSALHGFAAHLSATQARRLAADPAVAYVEQDAVVSLDATQTNATWGLDRVDQRSLPLNGTYVFNTTASNVDAYIIDTGIRTTHVDFGGRAHKVFDSVGDGQNGNDCNGHGTHVAGTVGGNTFGIAKGVQLFAVRVLNCSGSGTTSGVIAGINFVTSNHSGPSVANMSLGGGISTSLDNAVANSIASGVTYAIAAGNSNTSACNSSPARVAAAITVAATDINDNRASFSNFGSCVDIFAPGVSITSDWRTSDTATNTISGTSMATPHVTGAAALYLATHTSASPATVRNALVNGATVGVVRNPGSGSPNRLLFTLV